MFVRFLAGLFFLLLLSAGVFAAPKSSPSATPSATATPAGLSAAEMTQAVRTDSVTIPTPGETFAALGKPTKPDWAGAFRGPIAMNYKTRAQIALNLGGLIADGFIAVEAQDSQQVKNIGGDIVKMAKALGVSENILARGNSINQFAESDEWAALQEELEATQNEVKTSMQSHRDQDLVILVSLGGWIRGTQVVSGSVAKNYDEKLGAGPAPAGVAAFYSREDRPDLAGTCRTIRWSKASTRSCSGIEKIVAKPFGQGARRSRKSQAKRERSIS